MKTLTQETADDVLVAESCAGNVRAFGQIVQRYQTLLCSLAYSRVGNVSRSEDIAQETFIAAWTQIGQLREPGKLKSWLCSIARYRLSAALRHEKSRPEEPLDMAAEPFSEDPLPNETATRTDDEALAWRALELVPEIYRETMVLYYREHQSIEHVAVLLDLTEETVRQRLSRGRKVLQEQVLSLLTTTLTKTVPTLAFTTSVMSALPISTAAVGAASAGGSVVKGAGLKTFLLTGFGASGFAILLGFLGLAVGNRVAEEMTDSKREQDFLKKRGAGMWALMIVLMLGLVLLFVVWPRVADPSAATLALTGLAFVIAFSTLIIGFSLRTARAQKKIRTEEFRGSKPATPTRGRFQYTSSTHFLGSPLVAIDFNPTEHRQVKGWFAFGGNARGRIFALGQIAVAPIAVGMFSVGIVSIGCVGIGLLSFATLSLGAFAMGGVAVGYDALAGIAMAPHFAAGGVAWAHDFAEGGKALAAHANDAAAFATLNAHPVFQYYKLMPIFGAVLAGILLLPGVLMLRRLHQDRSSSLQTHIN